MKLCAICKKRPTRTKMAKFCEECFCGSRPSKVSSVVERAVREGRLKPVRDCICVDCGAPARHYDHRDYNKPDVVEPVCKRCNANRPPAIRYGRDKNGDWL